jgi:hypothetical protein
MHYLAARSFGSILLVAGVCSGQVRQSSAIPTKYVEIKFPRGVDSERVFIRYLLAGDDFGSWLQPRPGVSSYFVSTNHEGHQGTRIKAVLYAPGCAIQTLDLLVLGSNQQYSFICRPLPNVWIAGAIEHSDRLYRHEVKLQAKYVARWAQSFLGLGEDIVTSIPVGDVAYPSADGRFRLSVPDLSQDPLAAGPGQAGELQIWARDKNTEKIIAQLIPAPAGPQVVKARMGGLKIQRGYDSEIVFAPCAVNPPQLHDATGFALRPDVGDSCDR